MVWNVYSLTNANSKLRLFVKALVASRRPLSRRSLAINTKGFHEQWQSLIHKCGEVVFDIERRMILQEVHGKMIRMLVYFNFKNISRIMSHSR
jgi:hypothetical protein